jgi:hypothetical protein
MITADYDFYQDVLYINLGDPREDYVEEQDEGVLLRHDLSTDAPCGVTGMGFREVWEARRISLERLVSEFLDSSPLEIRGVINTALFLNEGPKVA